ncbi:hypothetical protein B6V00_03760, partial [ANME-1 cluster archaeon ex4572_4]
MLTSVFAALTLTGSATTSEPTAAVAGNIIGAKVDAGTTNQVVSINITEDVETDFKTNDVITITLPNGFTLNADPELKATSTAAGTNAIPTQVGKDKVDVTLTAEDGTALDTITVSFRVDVSKDAYGTATFTLTDSTGPAITGDVTTKVKGTETRGKNNEIRDGATIYRGGQGLKFDVDGDGDFGEDGEDTTTLIAVNT